MSIVLPLPAVPTLSSADAGRIAARGRKLLRRGLLTHRQAVLLDCLLWSCRRPGSAGACASYSALQRLAHQARETIAEGLRVLERLGLLSRIKRRVRVMWGGSIASRQTTSIYVLKAHLDTEFDHATVNRGIEALAIERASPFEGTPERARAPLDGEQASVATQIEQRQAQRVLEEIRQKRSTIVFCRTA